MSKRRSYGDSANQKPFFDSLCTCKVCSHNLSRECVNAKCICCKEENHSMVLDGMTGFEAKTNKKSKVELNRTGVLK